MRNKKYQVFVEDYNVPLLPWLWLNEYSFKEDLPRISRGRASFDSLFVFEKDFTIWAADQKEFAQGSEYFKNEIVRDKGLLKKIIDGHYLAFDEFEKIINYFTSHDLKKESNKKLFAVFGDYVKWVRYCFKWGMIIQILDMGDKKYSDEVKSRLLEKLSRLGEPEITFGKLITPLSISFVASEIKAVLKVALRIKNDTILLKEINKAKYTTDLSLKLRKQLDKLVADFGWLQFYYLGPPATSEYYLDLLKIKIKGNPAEELKNNLESYRDLKAFQNKNSKIFTKDELLEINVLKEFMHLKEARKEQQIYRMNYIMNNWYREVGRRFQVSPLQARYLTMDEYKAALLHGKKININKINERYNLCASVLEGGKHRLIAGKSAEKYRKLITDSTNKFVGVKELKGSIAYPGLVRGVVKIVNSVKDIEKFNEGNVLVSYSTNPSLVPAMNKASAIITNTGGVTCHAAIVSRELKTPCIIGTGIATKVLKDGDLVEVDAKNGLVRIIKN